MKCAPFAFCVTAALALNGCWFGRKPKPQPAPAPVQVPRAAGTNRSPAPTRKTPTKRKTTVSAPRAAQPAAIPPKAAETKNPTPAPEPQHLGRILSAEEVAQYRADYERSAAAAREMLRTLASGRLPPESAGSLGRIRSFLAQAQEAASFDPYKAAQLSYRAEVLARDLVRLLE
jgi:hypothetical protein